MGIWDTLLMDPLGFLGSLASGVMSMFGSNQTAQAQEQIAAQNIAEQQRYAQNRIQWTVADAKAAGINPLAALGNATQSFSNVVGAENAGGGLKDMGQNVGRALAALSSKDEEADRLNNDLTRAKIANVNADTVRQAAEASRLATNSVAKPTAVADVSPKPLFQKYVDERGRVYNLPSKDASSSMQNWASLPAQIPIAIHQAGDAVEQEFHTLFDPVGSYVRQHTMGVIPPASAVRRIQPTSSDYYYTPF